MSSKTKERKTSPAGAFYTKAEQTEKKVKEEIKRILKAPRYKHSPVRVLKRDGKRSKRKNRKSKSAKRKSTKRKRSKSKK
jgi:hypothetical protein